MVFDPRIPAIIRDRVAASTTSTMEENLYDAAKPGMVFPLGSGLIDHSQKMTVAASATAEKKTV
ncbi:hypothetical protein, partial [Sphingomonas sp. Leaf205]|uniref:hypothetical protein n=1 Tax=Sphingomonas sp. Leaf205 TaxID=2876551 RepID=UPI001E57A355